MTVPLPPLPTERPPLASQTESAPVMVTMPVAVGNSGTVGSSSPTMANRLLTRPPAETVNEPLPPNDPTDKVELTSHTEPAPVTTTVPLPPGSVPRIPREPVVILPPPEMVTVPVALSSPTRKSSVSMEEPAPVTLRMPTVPTPIPMKVLPELASTGAAMPPLMMSTRPVPPLPPAMMRSNSRRAFAPMVRAPLAPANWPISASPPLGSMAPGPGRWCW